MDPDRARQLLAQERERIQQSIAELSREGSEEADNRREPGDEDSEGLYQDEFDAGRMLDLNQQLEAVERAEARLRDGSFGRSVQSGVAIPDERLEAQPTAELTVEEQAHEA